MPRECAEQQQHRQALLTVDQSGTLTELCVLWGGKRGAFFFREPGRLTEHFVEHCAILVCSFHSVTRVVLPEINT